MQAAKRSFIWFVFAALFMLFFFLRPVNAEEVADSKFTVTLSANGGMLDTKSIEVENGKPYGVLPEPHYTGYDFVGWYTDPVFGEEIKADTTVELESDITLYARWKALKFIVTLNAGGGKCDMESITVIYGKTFSELPERLTINVDGRNMKPLKKEYTCTPFGNAVVVEFSNNYTGNALMRFAMDGRMLLPGDGE